MGSYNSDSHNIQRVAMPDVDPVVSARWKISSTDKVATAGSCFAQHIGRVKGYATAGASNTSSTVMGSRRSARGLRAAHSRCATATCARVDRSRPRSRRKRNAPSVRSVIGPIVRLDVCAEGQPQHERLEAEISRKRFEAERFEVGQRVGLRFRRWQIYPRAPA